MVSASKHLKIISKYLFLIQLSLESASWKFWVAWKVKWPAEGWEETQHKMADWLLFFLSLKSPENISSTRGKHFSTRLAFICDWKTENFHSKGKSKHLLIIHSSGFIFKRSLHFSYGNSGFYKQCCPQFHLYCVQYYIAIFTVERTLISEWSVCFKFLMKLAYTLVKNHNNPSISWLCYCSRVFFWGLGNESISPLPCNWHLHLK